MTFTFDYFTIWQRTFLLVEALILLPVDKQTEARCKNVQFIQNVHSDIHSIVCTTAAHSAKLATKHASELCECVYV